MGTGRGRRCARSLASRPNRAHLAGIPLSKPPMPELLSRLQAARSPKALFSTAPYVAIGPVQSFDVSPDDRRFLMLRETTPSERNELIVTQNWTAEMQARARQR